MLRNLAEHDLPEIGALRLPRLGDGRIGKELEAYLSVTYDVTAPSLLVSGVPWISSLQVINFTIQTEPGSVVTVDGLEIVVKGRIRQPLDHS